MDGSNARNNTFLYRCTSTDEDKSRQRPLKKIPESQEEWTGKKGWQEEAPSEQKESYSSPLAPCESTPKQDVSLELNTGDIDVGTRGVSPPNPQTETSLPPPQPSIRVFTAGLPKKKRQDSVPSEHSASVSPSPISPPP